MTFVDIVVLAMLAGSALSGLITVGCLWHDRKRNKSER